MILAGVSVVSCSSGDDDYTPSWLPEILVTVAVERVFTLYMMQDAVREMTIYMNTSIHTSFLFSYMPVTCAKHCFKGLLLCFRAVSSHTVTCQLHELCPSDDLK